jgi:hypothetical protein
VVFDGMSIVKTPVSILKPRFGSLLDLMKRFYLKKKKPELAARGVPVVFVGRSFSRKTTALPPALVWI